METIALQHHEQSLFDNSGSYISGKRLFYAHFKEIPCFLEINKISGKKVKEFIETTSKNDVLCCYKKQSVEKGNKEMKNINLIYCMNDGIFIDVEANELSILYPFINEKEAYKWAEKLKIFSVKEKPKITTEISLIRQTRHGLFTSELKLKKPTLDIIRHYNDDLQAVHQHILNTLKQKDKSGIILLHGAPGTGKSTYIRYLIHQQKKKIVFIPPKMLSCLESPDFTDFLIDHANTVFVIEDAEQLLISRNSQYNANISMLLNITDGLLGESLGIQIIATFNTHINNIDKALLRKGRLIALYEFKPLCIEKSKLLLAENNITNIEVKQAMTLADIYNTEQDNFAYTQNRASIGFASTVN
ncbi:MAG: AAA family ATPase [Chitinophagales bacterium]